MNETILVTGGCGFIGSHCCVELIKNGYNVIIVDNLINSDKNVIINIEKITNITPKYYYNNISDETNMNIIFNDNKIDAVIHLAGFKSVKESKIDPLKYYENNISNLIILLKCMRKYNVNKLIFSSSALVYGNSDIIPINEKCNINILNPYAQTKFMSELILKDCCDIYNISCISLRYFNPVGCHSSGFLEENYKNMPNNLFPIIISIYNGNKTNLEIFGSDYNTKDGTGVRDYIHVEDIARGHVQTLKYMKLDNLIKFDIFNLGTGIGYSVLDIINKFEVHTNKKLPYLFKDRRIGDPDILLADSNKANKVIGFKPIYDLDDMILSSLNSYQLNNHI